MYLFITPPYSLDTDSIRIEDKDFIHQISRVLRMQPWDRSYLQWFWPTHVTRVQVSFENISKNHIDCVVLDSEQRKKTSTTSRIAIARPNKKDKLELIAQKLTELWVDEITFFRSERSQYRPLKPKQQARVDKIVTEAVEQSWSWSFPTIRYCDSLEEIPDVEQYYCFTTPDDYEAIPTITPARELPAISWSKALLCVWPEWWWWPDDYALFAAKNTVWVSLWTQILRMETAAIIVWWILVDSVKDGKQVK